MSKTKWIAGIAATALVIGGGVIGVNALNHHNTIKAYDEAVAQVNLDRETLATVNADTLQAEYLYVNTWKGMSTHVKDLTTVSKAEKALISADTNKPVAERVKELAKVYTGDVKDLDEATVASHALIAKAVKEEKLPAQETVTVLPTSATGTVDVNTAAVEEMQATAAQVKKEREAAEKKLDTVNIQYAALVDDLIADGDLLAKPAKESITNQKAVLESYPKASDEAKADFTATGKALNAIFNPEDAKADDSKDADKAEKSDKKADKTEKTPVKVVTYEFPKNDDRTKATQLKEAFVAYITASGDLKTSHDAVVAAEAAEAAAAAAAAEAAQYYDGGGATGGSDAGYYNPGNGGGGNWTPNNGGGGNYNPGNGGGGGGWTPPADNSGGGGGGATPPPPSNNGGGGGGGTYVPPNDGSGGGACPPGMMASGYDSNGPICVPGGW